MYGIYMIMMIIIVIVMTLMMVTTMGVDHDGYDMIIYVAIYR